MIWGNSFALWFGFSALDSLWLFCQNTNGDNWSWHKHKLYWKWNWKSLFRHNVKRQNSLMSVHVSYFDSSHSLFHVSQNGFRFHIKKLMHTVDYKEANTNLSISHTKANMMYIYFSVPLGCSIVLVSSSLSISFISKCNAKRYWRKLTNAKSISQNFDAAVNGRKIIKMIWDWISVETNIYINILSQYYWQMSSEFAINLRGFSTSRWIDFDAIEMSVNNLCCGCGRLKTHIKSMWQHSDIQSFWRLHFGRENLHD